MNSSDSSTPNARAVFALLAPFEEQSRVTHGLVVCVGIAAWIGAYVAVLSLFGWVELASKATEEAVRVRRYSAAAASGVCALYFGATLTRAYGGLLLNLGYPILIRFLMPREVYVLFQPSSAERLTSTAGTVGGTFLANPTFVLHTLTIGTPLAVGLLLPIVLWQKFGSAASKERFERRTPAALGGA